jgi:methylated-DNA-[protein]-cysteine S-methyltransferase
LTITSTAGALVALDWGRHGKDAPDEILDQAARQLEDYFAGRIRTFDLPLAPGGSVFRQKVWTAMQAIPYGRVATYADIARAVGTAPRAVGGACAANPLPVIIPCHRVVGSAGGAGGYSGMGGLETKSWLLGLEQRSTSG